MNAHCPVNVCDPPTRSPTTFPKCQWSGTTKRESQIGRVKKQREDVNENNNEQQIILNFYDRAFARSSSSCNLVNVITGPQYAKRNKDRHISRNQGKKKCILCTQVFIVQI
jgi:hypothetical protein